MQHQMTTVNGEITKERFAANMNEHLTAMSDDGWILLSTHINDKGLIGSWVYLFWQKP